jgi:hypothetical protein
MHRSSWWSQFSVTLPLRSLRPPLPITHHGHVLAVLVDVVLVLDELGLEPFFEGETFGAGLRQALEGVHDEVETVEVVQYGHV